MNKRTGVTVAVAGDRILVLATFVCGDGLGQRKQSQLLLVPTNMVSISFERRKVFETKRT